MSYNAYFGSSGNGASGGTTTVAPTPVPDMTTVIQWESEGDNVRQYQQRLVELGYLDSKSVTGKFNQKTVEATKAFQTMNDLKVDGAAGPQSLKLIYSGDALDANGVRVGDKLGKRIGYRDGIRRADGGHERRTGATGAKPIGGTGLPVRLFYKRHI